MSDLAIYEPTDPTPSVAGGSLHLVLSGIDSLYMAYFLDTTQCGIDWDELAYRKEALRRDTSADFAVLELGTEEFALLPYGVHPYPYVLRNKAFQVRLAERLRPSCHVQFFSEPLWTLGIDALTERFDQWCRSMDFLRTRPESVSRVDFAFDYHLPVVDFEPDHFATRATKRATWHEHNAIQTVQLGQSDTVVRVYDKVAEIEQQSDKAFFFDLWGRRDQVWRVEFQVRGTRLRDAGIRTLDDLADHQGDLLREVATSHTTLRTPNGDTNRSRWPLHPLWAALQADIAALPQTGLIADMRDEAGIELRTYKQAQSVYGMLKRLAVALFLRGNQTELPDLQQVVDALPYLVAPFHSEQTWQTDLEAKIEARRFGL